MHLSDDKFLAIQQDWQLDVEPETSMPASIIADEQCLANSESQIAPDDTPPPLPRILEGLLFVADEPVLPDRVCQIIRGLTAEQFQETIQQLNHEYRHQARPYRIDREGSGYRLRLRSRF